MKKVVLLTVLVVALLGHATPASAGGGKPCSFAGTWYGGSELAKYLMTIVPAGGNSYIVMAQGAYSLGGVGIAKNTSFSGEMVKIGPNLYEGRLMSLLTLQEDPPPTDPALLAIDAAAGTMELTGCHELTSTIDYFVGYWGWGAEPFVDSPNIDYLAGGQIVEIYHRISMAPMD